jgi:hypothetical protein
MLGEMYFMLFYQYITVKTKDKLLSKVNIIFI